MDSSIISNLKVLRLWFLFYVLSLSGFSSHSCCRAFPDMQFAGIMSHYPLTPISLVCGLQSHIGSLLNTLIQVQSGEQCAVWLAVKVVTGNGLKENVNLQSVYAYQQTEVMMTVIYCHFRFLFVKVGWIGFQSMLRCVIYLLKDSEVKSVKDHLNKIYKQIRYFSWR